MIGLFDRLARPLLRAFDPEDAHSLAIKALRVVPLPPARPDDARLAVRAFGLNFPNPVGLAPGFDKHAEVPDALLRLGFGFVEIGTVTPLPQPGNPRPRRVPPEPGSGGDQPPRLQQRRAPVSCCRGSRPASGGAASSASMSAPTRISADRAADYVRMIEQVAPVASYVTVNISSPNTPGLRELQRASALDDLLARIVETRDRVARNAGPTPVLLKIAPDLSLTDLDDIVGVARLRKIDGMIVGNTTISRPPGSARRGHRAARPAGSPASRSIRWRRGCSRKPTSGSKARSR